MPFPASLRGLEGDNGTRVTVWVMEDPAVRYKRMAFSKLYLRDIHNYDSRRIYRGRVLQVRAPRAAPYPRGCPRPKLRLGAGVHGVLTSPAGVVFPSDRGPGKRGVRLLGWEARACPEPNGEGNPYSRQNAWPVVAVAAIGMLRSTTPPSQHRACRGPRSLDCITTLARSRRVQWKLRYRPRLGRRSQRLC